MSENSTPKIRVIIADDHELIREGFRFMLKKQEAIDLIAEAKNGKELVELTRKLQPDIIITDIKMPVMNGIEATKEIAADYPDIGIIALSVLEQQYLITEMIKAGAKGYIVKNAPNHEIILAIQAVYNRQDYYCTYATETLSQKVQPVSHITFPLRKKPVFNHNEIEIIKLICKEYSNKEIAAELNLSVRTIEDYRDKIIEKIDAKNSTGVVLFAIRNNMYLP